MSRQKWPPKEVKCVLDVNPGNQSNAGSRA
jgi:hypothetical protein